MSHPLVMQQSPISAGNCIPTFHCLNCFRALLSFGFMHHLEINTVSRKKLDRSALVYGAIAGFLLIGGLVQFFQTGSIRLLEELCRQLGVIAYLVPAIGMVLTMLALVFLRGLRTLLRKRSNLNGLFVINSDSIVIKKSGKEFHLTGNDLQELEFEIKSPHLKNANQIGESFVKIPSPNGTYKCELDINDDNCYTQLLRLIDHFESEHQVKIELIKLE